MPRHPLVFVIAEEGDGPADVVSARIVDHGARVVRWDTSMFPARSSLSAVLEPEGWRGRLEWDGGEVALQDITAVWNRRPTRLQVSDELNDVEREYAQRDSLAALAGLFDAMPDANWVNPVQVATASELKLRQLATAQQLGLRVPRTMVTNDIADTGAFFDRHDSVAFKAVTGLLLRDEDGFKSLYTTRLRSASALDARALSYAPCLLQEYVEKRIELRITIVGTEIFAAEVHSQDTTKGKVDFRQAYDELSYAVHDIPGPVADKLLALMRALGLRFATIDVIVTEDGDYVFLETNQQGQWGWIESATGLPIVDSLARYLVDPVAHAAALA